MNDPTNVCVGIDVSKAHLDVAFNSNEPVTRFDNDLAGHAVLIEKINAMTVDRVVLEATGGYERPVVAAMLAAKLPVVVINPASGARLRSRDRTARQNRRN